MADLSSSSCRSVPGRAPPACCRSRQARSAERSASVSGRSRSARASWACMSPSSRSYSANSSRSAASLRSSTPTRSRCLAANRWATSTVSWSWFSPASRPRRSASASRWRSTASSPSVRDTAWRVSWTDSVASATAPRIYRARSRKFPGGVAASRAALQHPHALAVLGREPVGYLDRLVVLDLPREPAAPLGVGEPLALDGELALGTGHRLAGLLHGQLRLDHRLAHLPRQVAQIPRRRRRIEGGAQGVPQALEHRAGS